MHGFWNYYSLYLDITVSPERNCYVDGELIQFQNECLWFYCRNLQTFSILEKGDLLNVIRRL